MAMNGQKGKIFNEINITPLTDIFLVLLIIMMFVAPMFQAVDKNIAMPEINSGLAIPEDAKNVTLSISKDGHYYINSKEINPQNLTSELEALSASAKDKKIIVKADASVKSKEIIGVIQAAQNTGFEKLVVAGEPLSKKEQNELEDVQAQAPAPTEENIQPISNIPTERPNVKTIQPTQYQRDDFNFEEE